MALDGNWAMWQLAIIQFTREGYRCDERHEGCTKDVVDLTSLLMSEREQHAEKQQICAKTLVATQKELAETKACLREAQALRVSLESVVSERLAAQLAADKRAKESTGQIEELQQRCAQWKRKADAAAKQLQVAAASSEEELQREHERAVAESRRAKALEAKLADVESFLDSDYGKTLTRMENDLAEARLQLAEAESEKDELELELSALSSFQDAVKVEAMAGEAASCKSKGGGALSLRRSPLAPVDGNREAPLVRGWLSQHAGVV